MPLNKLQIWCEHIQAALWCAKCASAICDCRAKILRYGLCKLGDFPAQNENYNADLLSWRALIDDDSAMLIDDS